MGTDKALLPRGGTTLLGHVLDVLAAAVDGPLLVVGAADTTRDLPPGPSRPRCRVLRDPVADRGPLQGIATGLGAAAADGATTAFVAAVDLPHLHPAFVRAVLAHRTGAVEVALPVLDGHRQPLLAAWDTALGARAADLIDQGERSLGALVAASRVPRARRRHPARRPRAGRPRPGPARRARGEHPRGVGPRDPGAAGAGLLG